MPEQSPDWVTREPHPALRRLITRYIGYVQHNVTLSVHRGLPSQHLTLIISIDKPIRVAGMPTLGTAPISRQAMVGGLHTGPVLITQDRTQSGLHIQLKPLGISALLGVSAAELSGYIVELADVGSPRLATLPARLAEAGGWPARFAILDEVFTGMVVDAENPAPEIGWAWQRMVGADGRVRVASLADEVGWSRRYFSERFRTEVGLSPKQFARVMRFERTTTVLRRHGRVDLAALAVGCGYYDQAHLTNEWQALAGCSPGTWITEELPFLQDEDVVFGEE